MRERVESLNGTFVIQSRPGWTELKAVIPVDLSLNRIEPLQHMTSTIDILLVDDHQLVRDGLRLRLDAIDGFRVVGEASNMPEALSD